MKLKHLSIIFLALFATSIAQSRDVLLIPEENDNQFPPDDHSELDQLPEGSGVGAIEEPLETTTQAPESPAPSLEDVQLTSLLENNDTVSSTADHSCPSPCVCNIEGDSNNYRVDCSGYELTELPKPLDSRTTELNLQNNKLTIIPKDISVLKSLKTLNFNNNQIMDIVTGSISELPELTSLKLANNRLLEFPLDLKNSFGLTKLEELDLGGNDMRTGIKSDTFSNFKALRQLTLPSTASELAADVCISLKDSLQTVCTESCNNKSLDCPDAPNTSEEDEDLLNYSLPGSIALPSDDNADPTLDTVGNETETTEDIQTSSYKNEETSIATPIVNNDTATSTSATALHRELIEASSEPNPSEKQSEVTETTSEIAIKTEEEVVGATTSGTKTGGVDKSVIGMIVAGMVLVVAGITIKKNWSSIRNRFSSSPRPANDRTGVTANGTTPEEVPLQEKSPV